MNLKKLFKPTKVKVIVWLLCCSVPFVLRVVNQFYISHYQKGFPYYQYFLVPWIPMNLLSSMLPQKFVWEIYEPTRLSWAVYYAIAPLYLYFLAALIVFVFAKIKKSFDLVKKRNENLAYGILSFLVLSLVGGSVFWYRHRPKPEVIDFLSCLQAGYPVLESYPRQCRTPDGRIFTEYAPHSAESILLEMPAIEKVSPGDPSSQVRIKGYEGKKIKIGEEFIIDPSSLLDPSTNYNSTAENGVGDLKLKIIRIGKQVIEVEVLADERFDGAFYPREKIERKEVKDGSCISAFPLVMDVFYEYCFELLGGAQEIIVRPRLESKSTMPRP